MSVKLTGHLSCELVRVRSLHISTLTICMTKVILQSKYNCIPLFPSTFQDLVIFISAYLLQLWHILETFQEIVILISRKSASGCQSTTVLSFLGSSGESPSNRMSWWTEDRMREWASQVEYQKEGALPEERENFSLNIYVLLNTASFSWIYFYIWRAK